MKPIQFILLPIFFLLLIVFFRKLRPYPILKYLTACILLAAMVFTAFLDSSTFIANWLGVGRGVDLVIYLSLMGLTVSCLLLYLRTMRLEHLLTEVIRSQSIQYAHIIPPVKPIGDEGSNSLENQ
ncbi:MAG: DUF2304 domain-containing protein [Bacteroidota bacterium]